MGIPPHPQVLKILKTSPGEIQMHKATGEAGSQVFSTQSFPVTGATTMHYPAMIDRVGLCRLGELGGLEWGSVIWAHFPRTTCREKEILYSWDWLLREF